MYRAGLTSSPLRGILKTFRRRTSSCQPMDEKLREVQISERRSDQPRDGTPCIIASSSSLVLSQKSPSVTTFSLCTYLSPCVSIHFLLVCPSIRTLILWSCPDPNVNYLLQCHPNHESFTGFAPICDYTTPLPSTLPWT